MKNTKRFISLLLCAVLVFGIMPTALAVDGEAQQDASDDADQYVETNDVKGGNPAEELRDGENTVTVTTGDEIVAAVESAPDDGTELVIELANDILISSLSLNTTVSGEDTTGKSIRIRLIGNGHKLYAAEGKLATLYFRDRYKENRLILGKDDGTDSLTLDGVKLTIVGPAINSLGYDRTKRVYCEMNAGVVSDGRDIDEINSIGISIGDTFIMHGGKVTRWQYAGVYTQIIASNDYTLDHRVFEMYDGEICYNRKNYPESINNIDAAVMLDYCDRCIIRGGSIHDNQCAGLRWGNYRVGQETSEIRIFNCEVYNNGNGIVLQQMAETTNFYGEIGDCDIHDNRNSGVVSFHMSSLDILSGTLIHDNGSRGIYAGGATVLKMSGGKIYDNNKDNKAANGGGVYVDYRMIMTGGEIYHNPAERGGAVYVVSTPNNSTLRGIVMSSGAKIHNNTASIEGADIYGVKNTGNSDPTCEFQLFAPTDETLLEIDNKPITGYFEDYSGNRWAPDNLTKQGGTYTQYKKNIAFIFAHTETYNVTFDADGGTPVPDSQSVDAGNTATKPTTNPTKDGYNFDYWMLNGEEYDFSTPVTGDITLVAHWTIKKCTVVFFRNYNSSDNTRHETQSVDYNGTATVPDPAPTRTGYNFTGWYTSRNCVTKFDFNTKITRWTQVYAGWEPITFTVTFDANGGSPTPDPQTVNYNGKAAEPTTPPSNGDLVFDGWTLNGEPYDFSAAVTGNITLVAQWKEKDPTSTLVVTKEFKDIPEASIGAYFAITVQIPGYYNIGLMAKYGSLQGSSDQGLGIKRVFSDDHLTITWTITGVPAGKSVTLFEGNTGSQDYMYTLDASRSVTTASVNNTEAGKTYNLKLVNAYKQTTRAFTITKALGEDSDIKDLNKVPGAAVFDVIDSSGKVAATVNYSSFRNGRTTVEVPLGTYTLKESGADIGGYELETTYAVYDNTPSVEKIATREDASSSFEVVYNKELEIVVTNTYTRKYGELVIVKELGEDSEDVTIPSGTTFKVKCSDGSTISKKYSDFKEDKEGNMSIIMDVPVGECTVEETKADISGYKLTVSVSSKEEDAVNTQPIDDNPGDEILKETRSIDSKGKTSSSKKVTIASDKILTITFKNTYTESTGTDTPTTPELDKINHYGYIIGYPDRTVRPSGNITRAEVATIFFRLLTDESRKELWCTTNDFSDVSSDQWFNNAVSTLANAGILSGYADGTFKPGNNITRAELATIVARFLENQVSAGVNVNLNDISGHWAEGFIIEVAENGIITGYPDGTFKPDQAITRAETVTMINRLLERKPDKDHLLDNMIVWPDNMDTKAWYYEAIQEATNSHEYFYSNYFEYEIWEELLEMRDWAALEKEWSEWNSSPNPGDVMP